MRPKFLAMAFILALAGCEGAGSESQTSDANENQTGNTKTVSDKTKSKASGYWEQLVWNSYRDNTGRVIAAMPFPSTWKVNDKPAKGEASITGPNGIKIVDFPIQTFMYVFNPQMQQFYFQAGQKLRTMPGVQQLMEQDFIPWGAKQGLTFVRHYEVPEVTRIDKWYNDQLFKAVPTQTQITAIGTEWKTAIGDPYFLLIHLNVSSTAEMQNWYYYCTGLEADATYFEKAKKQLLFALGNTHYPLEPIMEYNQREAQAANQSWAAHNQRMAQNQANFEMQQRAHVNKTNAINDAIMSGWQQSNASSDRIQEQTIDGIYERTNVVDQSTGQQYKVAAGANQYWMNADGEYISTNQQGYNPNLDENMNRQSWQELKEVRK